MAALEEGVNKAAFAASIFKRGQKAELFDGGDGVDELAELQSKLGELHAVWALERTGRDLGAAIWRPELGLAEVVLQKGKLLAHMGFTRGSKLYLFIEEAVYLVDRANLLLFLDQGCQQQQKRLLSLQEAHDLMLGSGVPLDRYLVFCKLLRAGYIMQRHPARWVLGPREDLAQAWAGWGRRQQQQQQQQPAGASAPAAAAAAAAPQLAPADALSAAAAAAPAAAPPTGPAAKRRKADPQQQQQQHRRSGAWWLAGTAAEGQQEGSTAGPSASPWLRCPPPGFMDSLPRCTVLPDAAQRARTYFPRMAPLPGIPLADLRPLAGPEGGRHLLHYDVFNSNSKFSRRQPGKAAYTVAVVPCTSLPTPEDMAAADAAAAGVPVRFSTIEKGDICFYGATHVELRSILL